MCNCGKKREIYGTAQSQGFSNQKNKAPVQNETREDVYFKYTGLTALSVTGRLSGKRYRFVMPGNVQPVDYRDAAAMLAVPVLKRVNHQ